MDLKTAFEEIVSLDKIGREPGKHPHDILALAKRENLKPASEDKERVLFLGIDIQNDFIEVDPSVYLVQKRISKIS